MTPEEIDIITLSYFQDKSFERDWLIFDLDRQERTASIIELKKGDNGIWEKIN